MVSQHTRPRRPPRSESRARILEAAAAEFAARGFDGAKVDRVAARAGVNKAMLYYHFGSKARLYQTILLQLFSTIAAGVTEARAQGGPADDQVRRFVRVVAATLAAEPHFPAIWLREMAEGGRHLTDEIVARLTVVLGTLAAILGEGRRAGRFGPAHPLMTQLTIVGPLLLFAASAGVRRRFERVVPAEVHRLSYDDVVRQIEASVMAAVQATTSDAGRITAGEGGPSPRTPHPARRRRAARRAAPKPKRSSQP
jgi:AcrR family transcriptional regulator